MSSERCVDLHTFHTIFRRVLNDTYGLKPQSAMIDYFQTKNSKLDYDFDKLEFQAACRHHSLTQQELIDQAIELAQNEIKLHLFDAPVSVRH